MSTHKYNKKKHYEIKNNAAFSNFNDGYFQIRLFPNTMLAMC